MADGSPGRRACPQKITDLTFSVPDNGLVDTKKCSEGTFEGDRVKLSFYTELEPKDSGEGSDARSVVADHSVSTTGSQNSCETSVEDGEDRKKRCFDRYDSSESSDSGVAVLSSTESSRCSSSDITEPRSPQSPESACSTSGGEEGRMPPWASDPAPPRRLPPQPAPARRINPPFHRRITEFFSHKMKPQNLKRECPAVAPDDTKRRCLQKNGVTHDLEKYISYLSQTLSPKLLDVGKQAEAAAKKTSAVNGIMDSSKHTDLSKNGMSMNCIDYSRSMDKVHTTMNGFVDLRNGTESQTKEKKLNGLVDGKKKSTDLKTANPSANGVLNKHTTDLSKRKIPIHAPNGLNGMTVAAAATVNLSSKKLPIPKPDNSKMNGIVSSTTKLDRKMNGVTHGSNNINLNPIASKPMPAKKEPKKTTAPKRTNRKSSACIANSKNLTWSKANNLKQVQLQKQNCANATHGSPVKTVPGEANAAPKMNIPNGVRQVSMTVNGNLGNLNVPVTNFQNCQINIPQPCNGTVTPNNLGSFMAMPQNVMLTTLRIPQNGIPAQTLNQQNNMNTYSRPNVNVTSSPTKLNGQFVFPLMQNLNGAVVQIPNLMAKMPNFVLPQTTQLTAQRQEHLQNQQAAQYIINGTLLKLANTMNSSYPNVNKPGAPTSQSIPVMSKNVTSMPTVGMTVQPKPNYTVNLSHPVLVPQPGFIVTSVPNINVKETWSYTSTTHVASSQTSCSNPIVHHPPPIVNNFTAQTVHSSSIPIAPVKPPDRPIQGTDPPSSTVQDEVASKKCDIPWLSKTVNNNIVPLDSKLPPRPFAQLASLSNKLEQFKDKEAESKVIEEKVEECRKDSQLENLRKVEEVARREETIFTQITVLKDVSSNVQSSLIEANFCSATTESSESGIGTDKSIDSPNSDSQASKECDDDSLSLSVSVFTSETSQNSVCQKSPILKQPKTLRFPPRNPAKSNSDKRKSSTDTASSVTVCMWEDCKKEFDSDTDLLDHLQATHVESQVGKENFVCLWERCKVRGKPSCSRLWLERHTLSHGGNKPFKCIFPGCERRFTTQILLERHVNHHFNEASPNASGAKKTTDSASKLMRRNGKKLRYRRQPWSARMFDFFDAGTMEGLAWRLYRSTRWRLGGSCPLREPAGRHTLTLHAALTATRYNAAESRKEALLTYYPPHVIEDEWVPEKDVKRIKRVEIAELPIHTKVLLYEKFCASYRKSPSPPPPVKKTKEPQAPASQPTPARLLPARQCTSSRLLNNLLAKQRKERSDCSATNQPMIYGEEEREKVAEVSGAKKRKMGRRYGGNAFWPCGR